MSRVKKSRSLKRVTGGVKTGSKERTKLENKQRKAKKKAANPAKKSGRQRSVYQKFLDDNGLIEQQHVAKPEAPEESNLPPEEETPPQEVQKSTARPNQEEDMWEQLENPGKNDIY